MFKKEGDFMKKTVPLFLSLAAFACMNTGCFTILSSMAKSSSKSKVTIEEQIVVNRNGIRITAKEYDEKGSWYGPTVTFLIENNSYYSITVQARDVQVNGYTIDHIMSIDVAKGTKANDTLTLNSSDIEKNGIETVEYIKLKFHVFNSDTWSDIFDEPAQINTSAYKPA